ncbi:hypothetical protein LTR56_011490 [Elasticomyces elasticus]|nr:hypothetical protein LTR56_011490 [Elasticomyces elasticus]KAK3655916.1 hypothetical protein LTR22_009925 [Elasticomyces elasticus]KAK5760112.1 hypothetical protein LTS12_009843 [Elasticomyces elasticus]
MVSQRIFELCRPILEDEALGDEDKTEKVEELLSSPPTSLKGKALEDAVLGALWQWKNSTDTSPPPPQHKSAIRSRSPAPWIQRAGTPTSGTTSPRPRDATPAYPPGFGPPPGFARTKSSTASPFGSPRPSPRLPVATPMIPHSPRLSAYQFTSPSSPTTENYGDYGSETVDWLVNDNEDASSNTSYGDTTPNTGAEGYMTTGYGAEMEMSPYDMLRSILQAPSTDAELESVLEANGYDLSQTINSLMEAQGFNTSNALAAAVQEQRSVQSVLIGHVCKFWLQGNCLAGPNCLFSHDPTALMQGMTIAGEGSGFSTPQQFTPDWKVEDYDSFPSLVRTTSNPYEEGMEGLDPNILDAMLAQQQQQQLQMGMNHGLPGMLGSSFIPTGPRYNNNGHNSRPGSRPGSRHTSRAPTPNSGMGKPNFEDDEAFPTLGSALGKAGGNGKRHHGKRGGHGHHGSATQPNSLADVVRLSPSPAPNARDAMRRGLGKNNSFTSSSTASGGSTTTGSRENSAAALSIPAPTDIPWLDTGSGVNAAYMKARQEAFKHGGLRNKFLQSAAQAWNRNDARGAKALSLRGQCENGSMREKHREAAEVLYRERNGGVNGGGVGGKGGGRELFVDLHGLHPEEAVGYLGDCLREQEGVMGGRRAVYAICGTGHHSKNGKDKVGKAIRQFLNDWRYAFREFSVPGDRNNVGGILGILPASYDKDAGAVGGKGAVGNDSPVEREEGRRGDSKVVVVREDPRKIGRRVEEGVEELERG